MIFKLCIIISCCLLLILLILILTVTICFLRDRCRNKLRHPLDHTFPSTANLTESCSNDFFYETAPDAQATKSTANNDNEDPMSVFIDSREADKVYYQNISVNGKVQDDWQHTAGSKLPHLSDKVLNRKRPVRKNAFKAASKSSYLKPYLNIPEIIIENVNNGVSLEEESGPAADTSLHMKACACRPLTLVGWRPEFQQYIKEDWEGETCLNGPYTNYDMEVQQKDLGLYSVLGDSIDETKPCFGHGVIDQNYSGGFQASPVEVSSLYYPVVCEKIPGICHSSGNSHNRCPPYSLQHKDPTNGCSGENHCKYEAGEPLCQFNQPHIYSSVQESCQQDTDGNSMVRSWYSIPFHGYTINADCKEEDEQMNSDDEENDLGDKEHLKHATSTMNRNEIKQSKLSIPFHVKNDNFHLEYDHNLQALPMCMFDNSHGVLNGTSIHQNTSSEKSISRGHEPSPNSKSLLPPVKYPSCPNSPLFERKGENDVPRVIYVNSLPLKRKIKRLSLFDLQNCLQHETILDTFDTLPQTSSNSSFEAKTVF